MREFAGAASMELRDGPKVVVFLADHATGQLDITIRRVDDPENAIVSARVSSVGVAEFFLRCYRAALMHHGAPVHGVTLPELATVLVGGRPDAERVVVEVPGCEDCARKGGDHSFGCPSDPHVARDVARGRK